jgi:hypothetical protein
LSAAVVSSIALRAALLAACGAGVFRAVFRREGGAMNGGVLYYTIQSNLWVFLITAITLALSIARQISGAAVRWRPLEIARFAVLVGITITFLVFWIMLAPKMEKAYLLSLNNLLVHTLVPLLFIADFFLLDRSSPIGKLEVLWSMAMPLYYFLFSIVHAAVNPRLSFEGGGRYPYFFLDVDRFGWFGLRSGLGVFWWVLILLGLTLAIGYLFRFLQSIL